MAKRKGLSKTIRFEVFKRDAFTCQYCGGKAPDVVLHVDHIHPVSDGGENEIFNLITACASCNGGKSNIQLGDNHVFSLQREQLEDLNERANQLKMMATWRSELQKLNDLYVAELQEYFSDEYQFGFNENGEKDIRALLKKYGFPAVKSGISGSFSTYFKGVGAKDDISASWNKAFSKIEAVIKNELSGKVSQETLRALYARGILQKRFNQRIHRELVDDIVAAVDAGAAVESIVDLAKKTASIDDFWDAIVKFTEEHRRG